jgi:hypothetical protein
MEFINNLKQKYDDFYKKYKILVIILFLIVIIRVYILIYIKEQSNTISFSKYIGQKSELNSINFQKISYLVHKKYINNPNYYKHIILYDIEKKKILFNSKLKVGDILIDGDNYYKFFTNPKLMFTNTLVRNIGFIIGFKISGGGDTSIKKDYLLCNPIIISGKNYSSKENEFETVIDMNFFKENEPNYYIFRHVNMTDKHREDLIRYNKLFKNRLNQESFFNVFFTSLKKHYCNISQKIQNIHSINYMKSCNEWYLNNTNIYEYNEIIELVKENNMLKNYLKTSLKKEKIKEEYNKNIIKIKEKKNNINFTCNQYIYILYYLIGIDIFKNERDEHFLDVSEFSYFISSSMIEKKMVEEEFIFITRINIEHQPINYLLYTIIITIVLLILLYRNSVSFKENVNKLLNYISGNKQ